MPFQACLTTVSDSVPGQSQSIFSASIDLPMATPFYYNFLIKFCKNISRAFGTVGSYMYMYVYDQLSLQLFPTWTRTQTVLSHSREFESTKATSPGPWLQNLPKLCKSGCKIAMPIKNCWHGRNYWDGRGC